MNWDRDDQDKALAWQVNESDKCPGCGTNSYEADDVTVGEITCRVCLKADLKRADVFDQKPPKKPGRHIVLRRRSAKQT